MFSLHLTEPLAPLSSQTTARTHFQAWQATPSHPYAEMPAVVGKIQLMYSDIYTSKTKKRKKAHRFVCLNKHKRETKFIYLKS